MLLSYVLFLFILLELSQSPPFALLHPAYPSLPQSIPTLLSMSMGHSYMSFANPSPFFPPFLPSPFPLAIVSLFHVLSKTSMVALAGVAQWIKHGPVRQRVAGSIPSQGTCLGCRPGTLWGAHGKQPHIDVSLPLFFFP